MIFSNKIIFSLKYNLILLSWNKTVSHNSATISLSPPSEIINKSAIDNKYQLKTVLLQPNITPSPPGPLHNEAVAAILVKSL